MNTLMYIFKRLLIRGPRITNIDDFFKAAKCIAKEPMSIVIIAIFVISAIVCAFKNKAISNLHKHNKNFNITAGITAVAFFVVCGWTLLAARAINPDILKTAPEKAFKVVAIYFIVVPIAITIITVLANIIMGNGLVDGITKVLGFETYAIYYFVLLWLALFLFVISFGLIVVPLAAENGSRRL